MRFCWFSDVHLADTPPSMRQEGYAEDIFLKLEEIAVLCKTAKVDYALMGGDWFNSKISSRISHNLVNASLAALDAFPCPIIFIVGSHDVPYGRLDLLHKRPIGTILRHPRVEYISDTDVRQLTKGASVRIFPVSDAYNNTTEEIVEVITDMKRRDGHLPDEKHFDIAMLHQPVVKEGSFPYPVVQSADIVGLADLVLFGHMHNYDGVWDMTVEGQTTTFVNVGAVSRGSMDEQTLARQPRVFLFDVDEDCKLSLQKEVVLKSAKSAVGVFKVAEKEEQVLREADIEALLLSVKETQFGTFSTQSALEKIRLLPYAYRDELSSESNDAAAGHFESVKSIAVEILEAL